MRDSKPYQNAELSHISQYFGVNPKDYQPNGHTGLDMVAKYGTWLSAPNDCKVVNVITVTNIGTSLAPLRRGFGIVLQQIADPTIYYLYWHCLPVFPIRIGDIVKQGDIVAQMGNSGFVMKGGKVVPIEDRNKSPYLGTHVHYEKFTESNGVREYLNPLTETIWSTEIKDEMPEVANSAKVVLNKMLKMIKLWMSSK